MTLEEIEARWKAATPGPWKVNHLMQAVTASCSPPMRAVETIPVGVVDAEAIAAAPTDIAYLLDRVREFENELVECGRRESVERALAHVRSARVHELEDRVREIASDNRSLRDRLRDEFSVHNESIVRVLDDLAKYRRAHAWLVENTSAHICAHQLPSGCNSCIDRDCDARVCIEPHDPMCEWVKARDLTL